MQQIHDDITSTPFTGTIIDIETFGEFDRNYADSDPRRYRMCSQVILGCITASKLAIYCCENKDEIRPFYTQTQKLLAKLPKPFYAFHANMELGVWRSHGITIDYMEELQQRKEGEQIFESKREAVQHLQIPQYDDPFNDNGALCMTAWLSSNFSYAIAHNRACLLKERDILLKRWLPTRHNPPTT